MLIQCHFIVIYIFVDRADLSRPVCSTMARTKDQVNKSILREVFLRGTLVFPSPQKPTLPNSNSTRNQVDEEPLCGCATSKSLLLFFFYGTHRNQSTFYLDDEERKSRGSRRLKYGSSDKDHDEDEKDAAAALDLDGDDDDDDDNDDDGCDDNYDHESEEEEEGSERQPKGKLFF